MCPARRWPLGPAAATVVKRARVCSILHGTAGSVRGLPAPVRRHASPWSPNRPAVGFLSASFRGIAWFARALVA